jgi:hypothetical protein
MLTTIISRLWGYPGWAALQMTRTKRVITPDMNEFHSQPLLKWNCKFGLAWGFAEYTCSALIDYCIENNYEPVWACHLENIGSYKLAQKIGFTPSALIPYYRLSK